MTAPAPPALFPTALLVALAWGKAIGLPKVAQRLYDPVQWQAKTGLVVFSETGGARNPTTTLRTDLVVADVYCQPSPDDPKGQPPFDRSARLAEQLRAGTIVNEQTSQPLQLGDGYPPVSLVKAEMVTGPLPIYGNTDNLARHRCTIRLRWGWSDLHGSPA